MSRLSLPLFFALTACGQSSFLIHDGDQQEPPPEGEQLDANEDLDHDGLTNGEEWVLGTDPYIADTDGDSYRDGDEVGEATDPNLYESRIYQGFWPYYAEKDALGDASVPWGAVAGDQAIRLQGVDQFGDLVDLYDFAGHDRPIIIDVSTVWCGSCRSIARWASGAEDPYGLDLAFQDIREAIAAGEVTWITLLLEDAQRMPADEDTVREWAETYPSDAIPVIADPDKEMLMQAGGGGLPRIHLIGPDMNFVHIAGNTGSVDFGALEAARAWLD